MADSGAVNQNPGPESATCWLFPDPDLAKSWLYPDPESANPQVEWFVPIGTNHHLGGVASQAGRSFWPGPPLILHKVSKQKKTLDDIFLSVEL